MVKMRKRGACLALALCLTAGSVTSSYASASTVIGGGVAVATEYAFAWLLGAVGLTAASVAVYENADSIKTWGGERLDEFQSFCNEYNSAAENVEEKVNGWCDRVAKGTIDTASDVWDWFKKWGARLYENTHGESAVFIPSPKLTELVGYNSYYGYPSDIMSNSEIMGIINSGLPYILSRFEYSGARDRYYFVYGNNMSVVSINKGGAWTNVIVSKPNICLHTDEEEGFLTNKVFEVDAYSVNVKGACYFSPDIAINLGGSTVLPDVDVGSDEYAYVGGASDIFDRDGSLDNLDLVGVGVGADVTDVPVVWTGEDDIAKVLAAVAAGEMSWAEALANAGVVAVDRDRDTVVDDEGATEEPIVGILPVPPTVPSELKDYTVDGLSDLFPFCLPFDLIDFIGVLAASPEAPSFTWTFYYPTLGGMKSHDVTVDLSPFDSVAELLRDMQCILFVVGLILITRDQMIKG